MTREEFAKLAGTIPHEELYQRTVDAQQKVDLFWMREVLHMYYTHKVAVEMGNEIYRQITKNGASQDVSSMWREGRSVLQTYTKKKE